MINEEKIFSILRKFDYLWSKDKSKNFCDIIKDLNNGEFKYMTDEEIIEKFKDIHPDEK